MRLFTPNGDNFGGRDLINTSSDKHWQALNKTKAAFKIPDKKYRTKPLTPKKREVFQTQEHLRNLMSLNHRITEIGRWQDRLKNPYDPVAHPALFFRKVGRSTSKPSQSNKRPSSAKSLKSPKSAGHKQTPHPPVFTIPAKQLEDILPTLCTFDKESIREYAQALVSAVDLFNVKTQQHLYQLQRAAVLCVPAEYPSDFQGIIQSVISQISKKL